MSYENGKNLMQLIRDIHNYEEKLVVSLSENQLKLNEIILIDSLYKLIEDKQNTTTQLAKSLSMSPSGISNLLNKLDKKGYIKRVHDELDRRKVFVFPIGNAAKIKNDFNEFYKKISLELESDFNSEALVTCNNVLKSIESYTK